MNEPEDRGLYQILGSHTVFGDRSLLYLGKTDSFGSRLSGHQKEWLEKEWEVELYLGRIKQVDGDEEFPSDIWEQVVKDAERLLIYFHSPPYNSYSIHDKPKPKRNLRIVNTGYYGSLYPEVSHYALALDEKTRPLFESVQEIEEEGEP